METQTKIYVSMIFILTANLAIASDDEFIDDYYGDDEFIGAYLSADDEFNYFETSTTAEDGGDGDTGGGGGAGGSGGGGGGGAGNVTNLSRPILSIPLSVAESSGIEQQEDRIGKIIDYFKNPFRNINTLVVFSLVLFGVVLLIVAIFYLFGKDNEGGE